MKRLIKFSILFLTLTIFTGTLLAQSNDGNGKQNNGKNGTQSQWIDIDGDGICDNVGTQNQGQGKNGKNSKNGNKNGSMSGNGKGNGNGSGIRPQDGTGLGRGNGSGSRTGTCDGSGPKGSGRKNGKK